MEGKAKWRLPSLRANVGVDVEILKNLGIGVAVVVGGTLLGELLVRIPTLRHLILNRREERGILQKCFISFLLL